MTKRKILTLALAVCMVAILAIGGSLAYLMDDEHVTNTMVVGNVQINIEEHVKSEDGKSYEDFKSDEFTLQPVASAVASGNNAYYNKVVRTFNTSNTKYDAYIRTIILFEVNDKLAADYVNEGNCCPPGLHFHYVGEPGPGACVDGKISSGSTAEFDKDLIVEIDGDKYYVVSFTAADKAAIKYDESLHTINGVWMDKGITSKTIDGWKDADETETKVEILVLSQGIQSEGLSHDEAMAALGEINKENVEAWFKGEDIAEINDWAPASSDDAE